MSRTSNRRLSRVEKLAAPVIAERKRREAKGSEGKRRKPRGNAKLPATMPRSW
jgi:hypothetical protein